MKKTFLISVLAGVVFLLIFYFIPLISFAQTPQCWVVAPINSQVSVSNSVTVYYENMNFDVWSAKIECGDKTSNDETTRCGKNKNGSCIGYCKYKKEGGPYTITAYVRGKSSSQKLTCLSANISVGNSFGAGGIGVNWVCRDTDPTNNKNIYGEIIMVPSGSGVTSYPIKDQCGLAPKNNVVVQFFCVKQSGNDQLPYSYVETPCASDEKCENGRCVSLTQISEPVTNTVLPSLLENDLSIEEVSFKENILANTPFSFLIKTKNIGTKTISTNFNYRVTDIKTNNTICSVKNTVNIKSGQTVDLYCPTSSQGLASGEYNLKAEVDYTNLVKKDTNKMNNSKKFSIKIIEGQSACNNNGIKENSEECDGFDFGGATCQTKGFKGGTLFCSECKISTSFCSTLSASANDSCEIIDPGEIVKDQVKDIPINFKGFNPNKILYRCEDSAAFVVKNNNICTKGSSGVCQISCTYNAEGAKNLTVQLWANDSIKALCGKQIKVVKSPTVTACTQEAKLCPDGSYVYREGANCEFKQCPEPEPEETTEPDTPDEPENPENPEGPTEPPVCETDDQCGYLYNAAANQCAKQCITSCYNPFPYKTQEQCESAYPQTKAIKEEFEIPLQKGWNQISVPISSPTKFVSQIKECKIQEIWEYNPARKDGWLKPIILDSMKGYFVLVENDCVLNFEGYRVPKIRILSPGWNMISSINSWKDIDPNDKCGILDKIYHFNPEKFTQDPSNSYDEIAQDEPLDDTQGYWVNIKNRCVISEPKQ